jgi:hypothetical protein
VFATTATFGLVFVAALNALVDPYGIYRLWQRAGINTNKPEQAFHDRLVSTHAMRRLRPDALLLGTSRTQVGLDPGSPVLSKLAERPLNVGLSGGTPYEALRQLQHASALGPVRVALMGLDVVGFNAYAPPNPEFSEDRLEVDKDLKAQSLSIAADWSPTLLSLEALHASAKTVMRQREPSYFYDNGRRREATTEARIAQEGGMRATMLWSEDYYLGEYMCFRLRRPGGEAPALEDLRKLIAFARERHIELHLFFSPSHARSQLALMAGGQWEAVEDWKRAVMEQVAAAGDGISLWDFSGADPRFTGEPVPPRGDTSQRMRWYWESSHYRYTLGEVVLARIFDQVRAGNERFGVRLTPANLEQELRRVRDEVATYRSERPDEEEEIKTLAVHTRARWTHCANGAPGPEPRQLPGPGLARD